jgi:hypothetical protein
MVPITVPKEPMIAPDLGTKKFDGFAFEIRKSRSLRLVFQHFSTRRDEIQRLQRNTVMRALQSPTRVNLMARTKLFHHYGVIVHLIGVLRIHA